MVHCQKSSTLFKCIQELSKEPGRKTRNNYHRTDKLLNKRSELIYKCHHANKFLLHNSKINH